MSTVKCCNTCKLIWFISHKRIIISTYTDIYFIPPSKLVFVLENIIINLYRSDLDVNIESVETVSYVKFWTLDYVNKGSIKTINNPKLW